MVVVHLSEAPVSTNQPRIFHNTEIQLPDRAAFPEVGAAQRPCSNEPAGRRKTEAGFVGDQSFRLAISRRIGRVVDLVPALIVPVSRHPVQAVANRYFAIQQNMTSSIGKRRSECSVELAVCSVTICRNPDICTRFKTREFFIEDEVYHAGDRVRSVGGGRASGHHFNARNEGLRERVDVDLSPKCRSDRALPVKEHKRPTGAQPTKVNSVETGRARTHAEIGTSRRGTANHRRNLVYEVRNICWRAGVDILNTQCGQRRRRAIAIALDPRSGHHDGCGRVFLCSLSIVWQIALLDLRHGLRCKKQARCQRYMRSDCFSRHC